MFFYSLLQNNVMETWLGTDTAEVTEFDSLHQTIPEIHVLHSNSSNLPVCTQHRKHWLSALRIMVCTNDELAQSLTKAFNHISLNTGLL